MVVRLALPSIPKTEIMRTLRLEFHIYVGSVCCSTASQPLRRIARADHSGLLLVTEVLVGETKAIDDLNWGNCIVTAESRLAASEKRLLSLST